MLKQEEELQVRHSRVQELATDQLQEAPASQDPVQARRIKDQVLSKMHEIDKENHSSQCPAFGEYRPFCWPTDLQLLNLAPPPRDGGSAHPSS